MVIVVYGDWSVAMTEQFGVAGLIVVTQPCCALTGKRPPSAVLSP